MSSEVVPPPDPRALLAVLEAQRCSESASRAELTSAARDLARTQDVDDLQVRRAADAYADAVDGFTPPHASAGYVFAALYAIRRRAAKWLGIPFVVLLVACGVVWAAAAWNEADQIERDRLRAQARLKETQYDFRKFSSSLEELEASLKGTTPAPPNQNELQRRLAELRGHRTELQERLEGARRYSPGNDLRRAKQLRARADQVAGSVEEFGTEVDRAWDLLKKGRALVEQRRQLLARMAEIEATTGGAPAEALRIRNHGLDALSRGDVDGVADSVTQLGKWMEAERAAAKIPDELGAQLSRIQELTTDPEILARAGSVHRQGRIAFDQHQRVQAKESVHVLHQLASELSEEYTLIITGGKWRYRNDTPSVRTYYVLVEAVDPRGVKLSKRIRNEEDGSAATVRQWGERVPFAVYERVRLDKQDNGRIDRNVFGRKARGRLDVEVEVRTDEGEIVPRTGQITRW